VITKFNHLQQHISAATIAIKAASNTYMPAYMPNEKISDFQKAFCRISSLSIDDQLTLLDMSHSQKPLLNTYPPNHPISEAKWWIDSLSVDEQVGLINELHNQVKLLVQQVQEVRQEFMEGRFKNGSVDNFLEELNH
jgi:hypothetical protein